MHTSQNNLYYEVLRDPKVKGYNDFQVITIKLLVATFCGNSLRS